MERQPHSVHALTDHDRQQMALLNRVGLIADDHHHRRGYFVVTDEVLKSLYPQGFARVEPPKPKWVQGKAGSAEPGRALPSAAPATT